MEISGVESAVPEVHKALVAGRFFFFFSGYRFFFSPLKINMEHNHRGLEDHFPF